MFGWTVPDMSEGSLSLWLSVPRANFLQRPDQRVDYHDRRRCCVLKRSYKPHLINEEVLVKCMHQHWRVIARPIIYTVLLVVPLLLILITSFYSPWGRALFGLIAIGGLAAWAWFALPSLARWYTTSYAVTSRRVLFQEG